MSKGSNFLFFFLLRKGLKPNILDFKFSFNPKSQIPNRLGHKKPPESCSVEV